MQFEEPLFNIHLNVDYPFNLTGILYFPKLTKNIDQALAYFVMPVDAIPDFIAGLGYTDDAAVFAALVAVLGRNLKPKHRAAAKRDIDKLRDD